MPDRPGISVYLSTFHEQEPFLEPLRGSGARAFLSLHMGEEFSPDYPRRAAEVCRWLSAAGFQTIADVSAKTIERFGEPDLVRLAGRLGLWGLRVDYGLTDEEIAALAREIPVAVNASTVTPRRAGLLARAGAEVTAVHNFYPRPETGLDDDFFRERTRALRQAGLRVAAFIPGDALLRGPVFAGLPTLERHRGLPPSVCFADLCANFEVDDVFVGDPGLSPQEAARIGRLCREGVLELPASLEGEWRELYGRVFTCREDSPRRLIRAMESREYSCFGGHVEPIPAASRDRGCVTVDNSLYGRYSGEVQLIREPLPADPRVNVVGRVEERYLPALDAVGRGGRFVLTPG